ncbi:WD40 repeat protein [Jejuia pallidilutea]|uniref:WD40 repeat protein n=1 Tax=Jejuia pallidilutea TaxID=504487 RepID=A0A362X172_9FLAO|nr:PD40 domain-containing protein [Jejuia pallidilutea]PQV47325.1 WD40 repeat protein [Jejuia pallidilutea]
MYRKLPILVLFLLCAQSFSQVTKYHVKNLKLNTKYPHFGVNLCGDNKVLFTSYQLNKKGKVKKMFDGQGILTIYKGSVDSDGNIKNIEEVTIDPKANIESITSATLSLDEQQLYITTTYTNKSKPKGNFNKVNFHIEVGEYKAGIGYTNFKVLPFCNPKYSYAHPVFSLDGKTLYFTANVKGGRETTKGASDIFKVDVLQNNTFGKIKNLGARVNSYSKEMFPTISKENVLYFASNKSNGYGGFDLYKSKMNADGTFNKAEKLPKPINSSQDDLSLVMLPNGNSGFMVSKRKGGKGDDDIYYFTIIK